MKQTKRQRIERLEAQLREKDRKIARLEGLLADDEIRFNNMQKTMESIPRMLYGYSFLYHSSGSR